METRFEKNVFIVEDSVQVRARLVEMLSDIDGVGIVGEAATPEGAVMGIIASHPDFVVMDYQLENGTGVDVLRAVRTTIPKSLIVMLTNHASEPLKRVCLANGADAFFDKTSEFAKVKELIAGVALSRQAYAI